MPWKNRWLKPTAAGGEMTGGNELAAVWHTTESGPGTIVGVAKWVQQQQSQYTILIDKTTGQMIQFFPADKGARAVKNDGDFPTNRHGKIRVQIGVVGRAADGPLTGGADKSMKVLMKWLSDLGVPEVFAVDPNDPVRSRRKWGRSGHHTHSSCPGNDHVDPGKINRRWLFSR